MNTKEIKKRINSIKNTKKITKAMEMIAAVKMRKAVERAVQTREYATLANELMNGIGSKNITHPLTRNKSVTDADGNILSDKHLLLIITSSRGLCGSYNSRVLKCVSRFIEERKGENFEVIAIGNKAGYFAKKKNLQLVQLYDKLGDTPDYLEALALSKNIKDDFVNGKYDRVTVFFTNYISGLSQEVKYRTILPVSPEIVSEMISEAGDDRTAEQYNQKQFAFKPLRDYEFEPEKKQVLNFVLPMLVDIVLYQALLESSASEHSSRMIAMKNASDSAGEMIDNLTLEYNKSRQAAITQEISEIVGGAAALQA
ncbi:MAG: ATP synthase F1 subunit gamma [Candidatus Dojkabacteria bacterium]